MLVKSLQHCLLRHLSTSHVRAKCILSRYIAQQKTRHILGFAVTSSRLMGLCNINVFLVVGGVLALALAYHLYTPVPEGAGHPWLLRLYISGLKMAFLASKAASYVSSVKEVDAVRSLLETFYYNPYAQGDPVIEVMDMTFDGVPVKVYRPKSAPSSSPAIVYIHGGGWTLLSANAYSTVTGYMARTYNVIVVSIDYRLAPENPYPIPFQDCLKATRHVLQNGQDYGINPKRVALAGDSAGGNLVAAVSLKLSEEDRSQLPALKFLVLIYPALQAFDFNTYSYNTYATGGFVNKDVTVQMWLNYLGVPELMDKFPQFAASNHTSPQLKKSTYANYVKHESLPKEFRSATFQPVSANVGDKAISDKIEATILDPYFAPLMASDLSKQPQTYFMIAENDPLRDDAFLYAERLRKAEVSIYMHHFQRMSHGFVLLSPIEALNFPAAFEAYESLGKYVKDNL